MEFRGKLCCFVFSHFRDQFSSVAQSCPTLCDPMNCSTPGLPVHHQLPESTQKHVHQVGDAIHPSHCRPLLLLPLILPSISVFSNESTLCTRWPKYWSFSFNISPSNEHPGLISHRMDWLHLLAVQGTLKSLLQYHSSKASVDTSFSSFSWYWSIWVGGSQFGDWVFCTDVQRWEILLPGSASFGCICAVPTVRAWMGKTRGSWTQTISSARKERGKEQSVESQTWVEVPVEFCELGQVPFSLKCVTMKKLRSRRRRGEVPKGKERVSAPLRG